jgi:nucleoid-associated protein YgaU
MSFPNLFKLEKLQIVAYSDAARATRAGQFVAMFNPQTFSQTVQSEFAFPAGMNNGTQSATFIRSLPSSLRLNLLLDGTNVGDIGLTQLSNGKTVQQRIDDFLAIAYAVQGKTHEPNYLKVIWGTFAWPCRLASMTVSYTSFDRGGAPLRAELDLELAADDDPKKQLARTGLSSPDVSHSRVVRRCDTLPLLTADVYGTPRYYLDVARANGLSHFRDLVPGQTLLFPPLAS